MTSTPTPEPAKITCPDCGGHPSEPKLRTEGGSLSCSFCNRTLTFNFMRDNEPEHRACACRASRNARRQTCGGDGEIDVRPAPSTPGEGAKTCRHCGDRIERTRWNNEDGWKHHYTGKRACRPTTLAEPICLICHGVGSSPEWSGCGCGRGVSHVVDCGTRPPRVPCEACGGTGAER